LAREEITSQTNALFFILLLAGIALAKIRGVSLSDRNIQTSGSPWLCFFLTKPHLSGGRKECRKQIVTILYENICRKDCDNYQAGGGTKTNITTL